MKWFKNFNAYTKYTKTLIIGITAIIITLLFSPALSLWCASITSFIIIYYYFKKKDYQKDWTRYQRYQKDQTDYLYWLITDEDKSYFMKLTAARNKKILILSTYNLIVFSFATAPLFLLINPGLITTIIDILSITISVFLIIAFFIYILNRFQLLLVITNQLFTVIAILIIHGTLFAFAWKPYILVPSFIIVSITFTVVLVVFVLNPYSLRKSNQISALFEYLPNLLVIVLILAIEQVIDKFDFLKTVGISSDSLFKAPQRLEVLSNNEQELNQTNKAIKTLVTDHYIGLITFYGLVSIIAVNFSNAIMKKKCDDNVHKAEKMYRSVIEQLYQHQTIDYQDLCKISYYGGNEYDILLISNPRLYDIIQQNELQKRHQLKNHHLKI
ncbi:hypothetical protein AMC75_08400 [Staphylococcus carnosus]|uniref:hypothetical protein n=1 Tax=Staphylococcus carnosus TaxID=1281 RepID=UPI0006ABB1D7|nr:hypothetical protein [Staphylococcus carnosus]ANZ34574.1 hypothetical protein BEK99_12815 [Staphylococcus carnosus]KOR12496.1 hypothetical protein AMC75_08400 [Staphylococcus carnosus]UTB79668.1 hypothetical protein A2I65_01530 [Staphylococcus carnosus]UTB84437.1 hypothetical protein A2I66_01435 [Staphylococcus carnosus]